MGGDVGPAGAARNVKSCKHSSGDGRAQGQPQVALHQLNQASLRATGEESGLRTRLVPAERRRFGTLFPASFIDHRPLEGQYHVHVSFRARPQG